MKSEMTKIAAALVVTVWATGAQAAVVGPTNMQITGGTFNFSYYTEYKDLPIPLFGTNDITDQYNLAGWDTSVPQTSGVMAPGASLSFTLGTNSSDQVNVFFAPLTSYGHDIVPAPVFPVFNGSLINGNVSAIDMRSFIMHYGTINYMQGDSGQLSNENDPLVTNLTMSGCVSGVSCNWTMSWASNLRGGIFGSSGPNGTWKLSGTITAVPEASTYGMMLAGLSLVGLAARRRRKRVQTQVKA